MEAVALAARIYLYPLTLFFSEIRNKTRLEAMISSMACV